MLGTRTTRAQNPASDNRNGRSTTPAGVAGGGGGQQTLLSWLEPPVQAKPTFAEAGLARGGVFEGMLPLGTLPKTGKKPLSTSTHAASTPAQTQLLPSAVLEPASDVNTPAAASEEDEVMADTGAVPTPAASSVPVHEEGASSDEAAAPAVPMPSIKAEEVAVSPAPSLSTPKKPRIIFKSHGTASTRSTPAPSTVGDRAHADDSIIKRGITKLEADDKARTTRASSARAIGGSNRSDARDPSPRRSSRSARRTSTTPAPTSSGLTTQKRATTRASSVASEHRTADKHESTEDISILDPAAANDAMKREATAVVEIAVQEAVDHLRYPTAWALRTLFDERKGDVSFLKALIAVYRQTADEQTLIDFLALLVEKKREGRRASKARNILHPDGKGEEVSSSSPKPAPFGDLVRLDLSVYSAATGDSEPLLKRRKITRTSEPPVPRKIIISPSLAKATRVEATSKDAATSHQHLTTPSKRRLGRSRSHSAVKMSETSSLSSARSVSPITKSEDNGDREESFVPDYDSPTPRVNGVNMGQVISKLSGEAARRGNSNHELGDESEENGVNGGRAGGAGAGVPSAAPQPMGARRRPANSHWPEQPGATQQGSSVSPVAQSPPPSSIAAAAAPVTSDPSPETLTSHTHILPQPNTSAPANITTKTRATRLATSRAQTRSSSVAPSSQTAPGAQAMPSAVEAHPAVSFPNLKAKLAASRNGSQDQELKEDISEVTELPVFKSRYGALDETKDKGLQLRLRAKGITNGQSKTESYVRPDAQRDADDLEDGGADAKGTALRPRPSLQPPSSVGEAKGGRATRSGKRRAPDDDEEMASPLTAIFPPFPDGASGPVSRDGTPVPSRAAKRQKTGPRVKTSPMKSKSGPSAGIPRPSGERSSPGAHGPGGKEDENDDYCAACSGNGDLVCCDGCTRAFHFNCLDPPMSEDQENSSKEWFCNVCQWRRHLTEKEAPRHDSFASLLVGLERKNASAFRLPSDVRDLFDNVKTGPDGEYEERDAAARQAAAAKKRKQDEPELPDLYRLTDADGKAVLCHECGNPASNNKPILPCQQCGLNWHMDCLDPPLPVPPVLRNWKCPAHVDDVLSHIPAALGPAHKYRRLKGVKDIEPIFSTGNVNNGYIDVVLDEPPRGWNEPKTFGMVYRLKESGIERDFLYRAKRNKRRKAFTTTPQKRNVNSQPQTAVVFAAARTYEDEQAAIGLAQMTAPQVSTVERLSNNLRHFGPLIPTTDKDQLRQLRAEFESRMAEIDAQLAKADSEAEVEDDTTIDEMQSVKSTPAQSVAPSQSVSTSPLTQEVGGCEETPKPHRGGGGGGGLLEANENLPSPPATEEPPAVEVKTGTPIPVTAEGEEAEVVVVEEKKQAGLNVGLSESQHIV